MTSILNAATVTLGPLREGVEHAAWSEDGGDGPNLIILRRRGDPDGYTLIVNDTPHTGGVLAFEVSPGETRFTLSAETSHDLGVERDVALRYPAGAVDEEAMRSTLARLVGGPVSGGRREEEGTAPPLA